MTEFSLSDLERIIAERASAAPAESYTSALLAKGIEKCAQKLGEEGVETALAAVAGDPESLTGEAADLLYHLLVLLKARGVPLADVMAELATRTSQSGHQEKASRADHHG